MKILMVCLGNICRSPLAHGIMEQLAQDNGLDWTVDSAGTGNWHVGQAPDRRSIRTAFEHGVDISKQVCRQFKVRDLLKKNTLPKTWYCASWPFIISMAV